MALQSAIPTTELGRLALLMQLHPLQVWLLYLESTLTHRLQLSPSAGQNAAVQTRLGLDVPDTATVPRANWVVP